MGLGKINHRTHWDYTGWVNALMTPIIVLLDAIEIDRICNTRQLIKISGISPQIRIINDTAEIALKMSIIDRIKTK